MINFIRRSKSIYCFVQPAPDGDSEYFVQINLGYIVGRYRASAWACAGYGRGAEDFCEKAAKMRLAECEKVIKQFVLTGDKKLLEAILKR